MAKGYQCPNCRQHTGRYEKGAFLCRACESIWWTSFDRPSAGEKRKGYACITCGRCTIHPSGTVGSAELLRCSTCATTVVVKASITPRPQT